MVNMLFASFCVRGKSLSIVTESEKAEETIEVELTVLLIFFKTRLLKKSSKMTRNKNNLCNIQFYFYNKLHLIHRLTH